MYDTKTLNDMGVVKGTAYDRKSLHKQLGIGRETNPEEMSVSSLYQNSGYLFSQIEPQEVVVGEDSVDLIVYEVDRVNDVNFTNYRVDEQPAPRRIVPFDADGHAAPVEPDANTSIREKLSQYRSRIQRTGRPSFPLEEKASDKFEVRAVGVPVCSSVRSASS